MSCWNFAICRVSFSRFSASWRACASASRARASRMNEMVLITVAITSDAAMARPAPTPTLWRRTNFFDL